MCLWVCVDCNWASEGLCVLIVLLFLFLSPPMCHHYASCVSGYLPMRCVIIF